MNLKSIAGLTCLFASFWGLPQAFGAQQSTLEILGVENNLKAVGVGERWTENNSTRCEARIIPRKAWVPSEKQQLAPNPAESEQTFGLRCKAMYTQFAKTHNLHPVEWVETAMAPRPQAIKDQKGELLDPSPLQQEYPEVQAHEFVLPEQSVGWQVVVKSSANPDAWRLYQNLWGVPADEAPVYQVVIRPKEEPIPLISIDGEYQNGEALVSPIKILTNDHYGLVLVMFRQTYTSPNHTLLYRYRPLLLPWLEYTPVSLDEAHKVLMTTSEYAMEPSEMSQGPNARHLAYRAFMRLLVEKPALADIEAALPQASPAGKLYWLALVAFLYPNQYSQAEAQALSDTPKGTTVIEVMGSDWKTIPFDQLVHSQAVSLGLDAP